MHKVNDVFISYRRYENDAQKTKQGTIIAKEIYNYLTSKGLRVFWDEEKMDNGPFPEQLQWHVAHAPNYIFIATEAAMTFRPLTPPDRDYVEDEVRLALKLYEENPADRVLLPIIPFNVDVPADSDAHYPEEIHKLFKHNAPQKLDADIPSLRNLEDIHSRVTKVNRGNLWNAGYRWLEQAKQPGRRFSGLSINRMILPQANAHEERNLQLPINTHQKEMRDVPLMDAIRDTPGHLYLIGEGGIGKTTALMSIMEEAYGPNQSDGDIERNRLNGQIPLFVELSRAPDTYGRLYEGGRSTFIQRAIYQQIRQDLKVKQISSAAVEQIEEVFNLDPDTAVKPIHDLFSHQSPSPEYLLLLDGLNEVSRVQIRHETTVVGRSQLDVDAPVVGMVLQEIRHLMEDCPNVRVILTSRSEEQTTWGDRTTMLYLSGVELDVIDNYLRGRALPEARIVAAKRNEKLREILRIPLFLTLYASLTGDDEILSRGEILCLFFHQKKEQLYTTRTRNEAVHEDVDRAASARQINRLTPDMQCFILDFILPEIAWRMVEDGEFYLQLRGRKEKKGLREIIWNVLHDESDTAVCGENGRDAFGAYRYGSTSRQNTRTIARELCRRLSGDQADGRDDQEEIVGGILDYAVLTAGVLQNDGASNGRMANYGFIHHHIRDYFAAVYQINRLRMAVFLHDYDDTETALDCLVDWKVQPLPVELRRFIGEALGEMHNAPVCDKTGKWHYNVPKEICDRNLIKRTFVIFRGRFDRQDGYSVWNLLEVLKDIRQDLSGEDFSELDLTSCEVNEYTLGEKGCSIRLDGARISEDFLMPKGHTLGVESAVYSPDGRFILTASLDGTAKIWNTQTMQLEDTLGDNSRGLSDAAYSPDGRYIVTAGWDGIANVWDVQIKQPIGKLVGHTYGINAAAYSPNGKFIVTASNDDTAKIWNAQTLQLIGTLVGHEFSVNSASYNPDGRFIVTASMDGTAKVWNAQTQQLVGTLKGHVQGVNSAAYSPDGRYIVTASDDETAKVWDAKTFQLIGTLKVYAYSVNFAAYSPDGRFIVTASQDRTADVWDAQTLQRLSVLVGHTNRVNSARYSHDGRFIVTSSWDNTIKIWSTQTMQLFCTLKGLSTSVYSAMYSPDGRFIATISDDRTVKIWDSQTFQLVGKLKEYTEKISSISYSPNGQYIVVTTSSWDDTAKIWDVQTLQPAEVQLTDTLEGCIDRFRSAPYKLDLRMAQRSGSLKEYLGGCVFAAYSPDGHFIVTSACSGILNIWDTKTMHLAGRLWRGARGITKSVSFSPNGQFIVTALDHIAQIWDIHTMELIGTLEAHKGKVNSAIYSPNGQFIVTVSDDKTAKVWNAKTRQLIGALEGHTERVTSVAYSPDSRTIATASWDKTVKVWNAQTRQQIGNLQHEKSVYSAVYSPDGRAIASCSGNSTLIWSTDSFNPIHTIHNIPGLEIVDVDLRHLQSDSHLSDKAKERLYEYGAIVDEQR